MAKHWKILPPNLGSIYGLSDVRGYTNTPSARYRLLLECAEGTTRFSNQFNADRPESPIYRMLANAVVFSPRPMGAPLVQIRGFSNAFHERADALGRAYLVHTVRALPDEEAHRVVLADPAFDPSRVAYVDAASGIASFDAQAQGAEVVAIREMTPTRVTVRVRSTAPGLLVLADTFYPGWKARLDDAEAPVVAANWGLRGVMIESPGEHTVVFRYQPWWLRAGGFATALGLAGLAVCGVMGLRRKPAAS